MRPRELTIRGFRSYAEEVTFDFTGRSLIGIFGPTGGGKSSILDAIAFALYGKTPRIERDTKSLINQRRDSLHVSLTFEVDGATWKAVRSLRRGGQSAHALYRVDDDGEHETTDRAREMAEQIETILGLDFDAFGRSVLLAQNQFARFLEATPVERGTVLKGVFGFDRLDAMRDATKRRLDGIGAGLQVLSERRASAESDRSALPGRQEALAAAAERVAALRELRVAVGEIDETLRGIASRSAAARGDIETLDGLAGLIPQREATDEILRAVAGAGDAVSEAAAALGAAEQATAEAREQQAAALEAAGGQAALHEAADLIARLDAAHDAVGRERSRLEEVRGEVEQAQAAAAATETERARVAEAAERAAAAAAGTGIGEEEARRAVHDAHTRDRVRSLRVGLAEGQPCPVCEQVVTAVPDSGESPALDEVEQALVAASRAAVEAREAETEARTVAAKAEADAEAAARRLDEVRSRVESIGDAVAVADSTLEGLAQHVAERLGDGDPHERLAALRAGVAEAGAAVAARVEEEAAARKALDGARERGEAARSGLDRLRSTIDKLGGSLGVEVTVGAGAEAVEEALQIVREEWLTRRAAATEEQERCAEEAAKAQATRAELLEGAGLEAADDLVELVIEADRAVTALATEVELVERRLADLERLDEREAGMVEQAALLERLHADLRPSAFLDYVLGERRRTLADLAGDHFETLTAGRYRFSEDGDFYVLDLSAAEGRRAPASLSGGETFLASLALALALAEIVGRQGGRLDAFFIDEGFGSLDPEHVDLAMDGVERLVTAAPDRLVVVVSHLDAMRDRIEDLIVLSRNPVTDHTVVERGAAP